MPKPRANPYLDVVEEWHDKTQLNYLHYLLALRKDEQNVQFLKEDMLKKSSMKENLQVLAKEYACKKEGDWKFYFNLLNSKFSYLPNEDIWDSLPQYYEYLFFYGVIDFIPEINYC